MSKVIKQMEMDALRSTFQEVRDAVVLSVTGLNCQLEGALRATLRKKNIRLKMVKNSLTRRVFDDLGVRIGADSPMWIGPTAFAWGAGSVSELSRAIDDELKKSKNAPAYKDKVNVKGALADGQVITFEQALKMPTKVEAVARIVNLALSPGSRLVGQFRGPASRLASQLKTLSEKQPGEGASPAPAEAAPAT
jgi:large subunit ribosomal protein L10